MTILSIVHILACVALIVIVLLQADKGEGLSGAFGGGGSYAVFGKKGATGFIAKMTTAAAVIFMLTSFGLTYFVAKGYGTANVGAKAPIEAPRQGGNS